MSLGKLSDLGIDPKLAAHGQADKRQGRRARSLPLWVSLQFCAGANNIFDEKLRARETVSRFAITCLCQGFIGRACPVA